MPTTKERLQDWIDILMAEPKDTAVTLMPSEVERLIYDLKQAKQSVENTSNVLIGLARGNRVLRAQVR